MQYEHPNIVQLIGVVAELSRIMYTIMEIMPGGSFLDFLRKKGTSYTKKQTDVDVYRSLCRNGLS